MICYCRYQTAMSFLCSLKVTGWERADFLAPLYVFSCVFVTFHTVPWVKCGTEL